MLQIDGIITGLFITCIFESDALDCSGRDFIRSVNLLGKTIIVIAVAGQEIAGFSRVVTNNVCLHSGGHERASLTPLALAVDATTGSLHAGVVRSFCGKSGEGFRGIARHGHLRVGAGGEIAVLTILQHPCAGGTVLRPAERSRGRGVSGASHIRGNRTSYRRGERDRSPAARLAAAHGLHSRLVLHIVLKIRKVVRGRANTRGYSRPVGIAGFCFDVIDTTCLTIPRQSSGERSDVGHGKSARGNTAALLNHFHILEIRDIVLRESHQLVCTRLKVARERQCGHTGSIRERGAYKFGDILLQRNVGVRNDLNLILVFT